MATRKEQEPVVGLNEQGTAPKATGDPVPSPAEAQGPVPAAGAAGTGAGGPPAPGAFYAVSPAYTVGQRDIWFSSVGQVVTSYTFDANTVPADPNGDKIVREGTVLTFTAGGKVMVRSGAAPAVGVLLRRVNLRDGDQEVSVVVGGHLVRAKLTDNGVFGSVAASAEDDLRNLGVFLK